MNELKQSLVHVKSSDDIVSHIIKHIHFNPKYPEYQNVRATNLQPDCKYMDVFENGWIKEVQRIVLHKLNSETFLLTNHLLELEENKNKTSDVTEEMTEEEYSKMNGIERYHRNYIQNPGFLKRIEDKSKVIVYNETKQQSNEVC